jgi:hypothetical protein
MAKRNSRNNNKLTKFKKMEPVPLKLIFATDPVASGGGTATYNIDISQCASLVARKFMRQGLNWAVAGIKVASTGFIGSVYTQKLPITWTMSNAWHKGFEAWQDMNEFALEDNESVKPRFLDFKIYSNAQHHNVGFGANLLPICLDSAFPVPGVSTAIAGEWEPSQVHIPSEPPAPGGGATRDREIIAVGASYPGAGASGFDAVSLIEGYASSRGLPDIKDPNAPDDLSDVDGIAPENWIGALKNEGTEQKKDVLADMLTDNNTAPYPFENGPNPLTPGVGHPDTMYPGGANNLSGLQVHDLAFITNSTVGGQTRVPGGLFPCGLLQLHVTNTGESTANLVIELELVPGHHRGYLAESMQDM